MKKFKNIVWSVFCLGLLILGMSIFAQMAVETYQSIGQYSGIAPVFIGTIVFIIGACLLCFFLDMLWSIYKDAIE